MTNGLAALNAQYLAICVSILAIAAGFIYLINIKPLGEKLDKQQERLIKMEKEIGENLFSSKQEIRGQLEDFKVSQTGDITLLVNQKNENLKSELEKKFAELSNELGAKMRESEKSLLEKIASQENEIVLLKLSTMELQAHKYHTEGKMGGILYLIELLENELKYGHPHMPYTLSTMNKIINEYEIDQVDVDRLFRSLEKITDSKHAELVKEIRSKVRIKK